MIFFRIPTAMVSKMFSLNGQFVSHVLISKHFAQSQFPSFLGIYFKYSGSILQLWWQSVWWQTPVKSNFFLRGPSVKYMPSYCPPHQPSLKHLFSVMHTGKTCYWLLICWGCFFPPSFMVVSVVPLVSRILICTLKIFVCFRHKSENSVLFACSLSLQWFKCVCSYMLRLEGHLCMPNSFFIYMAGNLRNFIAFPRCEGCSRAQATLLLLKQKYGLHPAMLFGYVSGMLMLVTYPGIPGRLVMNYYGLFFCQFSCVQNLAELFCR